MNYTELSRTIAFTAPLVSAMVCLVLTAVNTLHCATPELRRIRYRMIAGYLTIMSFWFGMVGYSLSWDLTVCLAPVLRPLYLVMYVVVYGLMRTVTGGSGISGENNGNGGGTKPMSGLHYVVPLCVAAMELVMFITVPAGDRTLPAYGSELDVAGYVVTGIAAVYSVLYPVLCIRVLARHLRSGPVSHRGSIIFLMVAMSLRLVMLPVPIGGMILGKMPLTDLGAGWFVVVIPSFIAYSVSCMLLLSHGCVDSRDIDPTEGTEEADDGGGEEDGAAQRLSTGLSRERIDAYLEGSRPWLDPDFTVDDMARDLLTNRTYMSTFINAAYGMNFNRLVNSYRLTEMDILREEAELNGLSMTISKLATLAGFSNYRSYHRARGQE